MTKKVQCCKCDKKVEIYNWFNFTYAKPEYEFTDMNRNVSRFCLCHKCTGKLAVFLEASRGLSLQYSLQ